MECFWSEEKCGDSAIVINHYDLWLLILKETHKFIDIEKNQNDSSSPLKYVLLANRILLKASEVELQTPFKGIDDKIKEAFLRK